MDNQVTFNALLEELYTEEGRVIAIEKAVEKSIDVDSRHIEHVIEYHERRGSLSSADKFIVRVRGIDGTVKFYEAKGMYQMAARLSEDNGNIPRAMELYEKAENWSYVAELAKKNGDFERALQNYVRAVFFDSAAEMAMMLGDTAKANKLFDRSIEDRVNSGSFGWAATAAKKKGDTKRAKELLEREIQRITENCKSKDAGYYTELANAAYCAKEIGELKKAMEIYAMIGTYFPEEWSETGFKKAAEIAEKIGDIDKAIYYYEKDTTAVVRSTSISKAVELAQTHKGIDEALQICERNDSFGIAAALMLKVGNIDKAIEYYGKEEMFESAANLATDVAKKLAESSVLIFLGRDHQSPFPYFRKAAELFERQIRKYEEEGELEKAVKLARKINEPKRALQVYEKAGAFVHAAVLAREMGEDDAAIKYCKEAGCFGPLGELYEDKGDLDDAILFYTKAIEECKMAKLSGSVELQYAKNERRRLSQYYEKTGKLHKAAELAKENKEYERAIGLYEKAHETEDIKTGRLTPRGYFLAALLAEEIGDDERAIEFYKRDDNFVGVARILKRKGNLEGANALYDEEIKRAEEHESFSFAAHLAEEKGDIDGAIEFYKKDRDPHKVQELAEKTGNVQIAIDFWEGCDAWEAANLARKCGNIERAIQLYEKAGLHGWAASVAAKNGNVKRALQIYERAGMFADAVGVAQNAGMTDKANTYRTIVDLVG